MTPSSRGPAFRGLARRLAVAACLYVLFIVSARLAADDGTYCAYEVTVKKPSGEPVAGVPVGLVQKGEQIAESEADADGKARLCDAPLDAVDIFVGFDACGQVLVRHVDPLWLRTRQVSITYAPSRCSEFLSFPTDCHVLLRVVDEGGHFLPGALLDAKNSEGPVSGVSDEFGRVFLSLKKHEYLQGTVKKKGYGSSAVSCECASGDPTEVKVVVHRRQSALSSSSTNSSTIPQGRSKDEQGVGHLQ